MPIHQVDGGWQWGGRGKVYKDRADAERQAAAAHANGFTGDEDDAEDDMQPAHDEAFAFDRASVRRYSDDGHLHVEITPISKAAVNPYLGSEIPGWEELGLKRDKVYQLLRDPEELKAAASSFNNLPLLSEHVPVSADDHPSEIVIGSTGTNAVFKFPYLLNSLVIWKGDDISKIESGSKKEISSAYKYDVEMSPGVFEGAEFDGRMKNLRGNHCAIVEAGRAGSDVAVGDSALVDPGWAVIERAILACV